MKRLMARTGFVVLLLSTRSYAQSGAVIPPADAGHGSQGSCVIVKRMAKSRLYSLGISGKRFHYIEGKLPEGFSFHGKMTDHDVRNLQARGAQVLVLDSHYTSRDLEDARSTCQGETGKTVNQADQKAPPAPAPAPVASTPAPTPKARTPKPEDSAFSRGATDAALVAVSSNPTGAELYIDDHFFGRTPSTTIILEPGDHKIAVRKDGFVVWKKKLKFPSGPTDVAADLLPKAK